jgi:hypothetical protein
MKEVDDLILELNREAWDWLYENHPTIADKVQACVVRGKTPEQIRSVISRHIGPHRHEFVKRCENAASYLMLSKEK